MPFYSYTTKDGQTFTERYAMGEAPAKVRLPDGQLGHRDVAADHRGFRNTPGNWPMECTFGGVNPSQRKEAEAKLRAEGVPTHYTEGGSPIITGRKHYKKWCRATGHFVRNAGYSDAEPVNFTGET